MQRGGRRGQDPLAQRAEMIGIDLLTEGAHARWTVQERADGGGTLGQRETGSPVQETPGLVMARRDGHLHPAPLTAGLDQLDLQRLVQAIHWGYVVHLTSFCAHRSSPCSCLLCWCSLVARLSCGECRSPSSFFSVRLASLGTLGDVCVCSLSAGEYSGFCCCALTPLLSGLCLWGPFLLGPIGLCPTSFDTFYNCKNGLGSRFNSDTKVSNEV